MRQRPSAPQDAKRQPGDTPGLSSFVPSSAEPRQRLPSSNVELSYARRGSGEPLVLIHGIGHRWQAWEPVLDRLAEHHDVIAIDIPGFGKSAPLKLAPGQQPSVGVAMERIAEAFPGFGIERPHVAGNSLGGALALEMARHGLASSATAFSPAGFWHTRWETAWALGNLNVTRAAAFAPVPVLKYVADHGTTRALAFGMIFGKPRLLDPKLALEDTLALRDGRVVPAGGQGGQALPVRRGERRADHGGVGHQGPHPAATAVRTGQARAAEGPLRGPAGLRARADERRPRACQPADPGDHGRPARRTVICILQIVCP